MASAGGSARTRWTQSPAGQPQTGQTLPGRATAVWLAAIMGLALAVRLHAVGFGLPAMNDPDELIFELGALRMLRTHSLNPAWFGHPGTTTMEVLAAIDAAVFATGRALGWFPGAKAFASAVYMNPAWIILPGRVAMALFGAGCVWQTWRLARAVGGLTAGLAAAALLAVEPVSVGWSQVIRTDVMATFFLLLGLRAALRVAEGDRWRDWLWAGAWIGIGVATKWPTGIGALALAGAAMVRLRRGDAAARVLPRLIAGGAAAAVALLAVSPYLLLDFATVVRNLHGEAQTQHLGATGGPPLANLWWYARGAVWTGLGPGALILAAIGLARLVRQAAGAVILPPVLAMLAVICVQTLVWERWIVPVMPVLALAAGLGWAALAARLELHLKAPAARAAALGVLGLALAWPALATAGRDAERRNDARQLASAWARAHIPAGSTVLVEHFAFDLLPRPWRLIFPMGLAGCIDTRALLGGKVQYSGIDGARGGRSNLDYGTLPPDRRGTCPADYAILTQYDRYAAEPARFPGELAMYRELLSRGRIVATFATQRGKVGGWTTRIVALPRGQAASSAAR